MFRTLGWLLFYVTFLGLFSVEVTYSDGLHIHARGWPEIIANKLKARRPAQSRETGE